MAKRERKAKVQQVVVAAQAVKKETKEAVQSVKVLVDSVSEILKFKNQ